MSELDKMDLRNADDGDLVPEQVGPPTYDSAASYSLLRMEIRELFRYRDLIRNLIVRNVAARYKRSVLGVLWTLLDPLLTMLVMSVVFTALFRRSLPGFPVFLLSGLLAWNFFSQASNQAMNDMVRSGNLIGRVSLPKSVFAVAAIGTNLVNYLIALIPLIVLILVFQRPITTALFFIPIALLILSAFTLGVSLFMSTLAVFFLDTLNLYGILLRLLFFTSGVIFSLEMMPEPLQDLIGLNPAYHLIVLFRFPLYEGVLPPVMTVASSVIWAVIALAIGLIVFTRFSETYIYRI